MLFSEPFSHLVYKSLFSYNTSLWKIVMIQQRFQYSLFIGFSAAKTIEFLKQFDVE